jgi:hypothetical protein
MTLNKSHTSDFFLFEYIKNRLIDRQYETENKLLAQVKNVAQSISCDVRIKVFKEWIERLQIYIRKMETMASKRHFYS